MGSQALEQFDEHDIGDFLTTLAVTSNVSPSTQTQAQSALLFLYQCVIGKKIGFLNAVRARKSESIPVWFSQAEIEKLLEHFVGEHRLMFLLIYGAGLRHKECRRLRIKDICFDEEYFATAFKRALKLSGINKNGVPHSLRHSFATHLIEGGTDIQTVQQLMGHKDVKPTMGYVHVTQKLGVSIQSPIDKLQPTS